MAKIVNFTFRGLMVGAFTPFNKDLSLNIKIIPKYAKFLADSGVPGVLVNGTTSEGPALTVQERKTLAEAWLPAIRETKQHLMVQVAACPLPYALELARHAEEIGVDSILCLPELYFKPKTSQELIDYLKVISEAAPNTPLIYYHNPNRSGVNVDIEQFLNLAVGQIPTFHGIKYALSDMSEAYNAQKAADGRYTIFIAADAIIQPALAMGFDSFSTSSLNIFPRHYVKIIEAMKENKVVEARAIQEKLTAGCRFILKNGNTVAAMKAAMNIATPINVGPARLPLKNPTEAQQKQIETNIKEYDL